MKSLYLNKFKNYFLIITTLLCFSLSASSVLDVEKDDFFIGNENAPVTIIEYASLSCSHCADFHINTLPTLIEEYVDSGKVKIVFRHFPFNYPALLGSMVLHCVPNDVRFDYTEALYFLQKKWVVRENKQTKQELFKIMQSGGMTKDKFDNCINNTEIENSIIQKLVAVQNEYEIKSTPSFLINGQLLEGNKPIDTFRKIIENELQK